MRTCGDRRTEPTGSEPGSFAGRAGRPASPARVRHRRGRRWVHCHPMLRRCGCRRAVSGRSVPATAVPSSCRRSRLIASSVGAVGPAASPVMPTSRGRPSGRSSPSVRDPPAGSTPVPDRPRVGDPSRLGACRSGCSGPARRSPGRSRRPSAGQRVRAAAARLGRTPSAPASRTSSPRTVAAASAGRSVRGEVVERLDGAEPRGVADPLDAAGWCPAPGRRTAA